MKTNNIKINEEYIRKFNPCRIGIDKFTKNYPNWEGNLSELLKLDNIPFSDKMWLCKRVIKNVTFWQIFAIDTAIMAEVSVEYKFNKHYAADAAAYAADAAAYAADAADTADAADAATYAALDAADAAAYAAADAAAACAALDAAATAATTAAYAAERERQLEVLIYLLETEEDLL